MKSTHNLAALTLIELLVVISIGTIVVGLLVPVLGRMRESAKNTQCLSSLHQMVMAANTYVVDHRGYYPMAYYDDYEGTKSYSFAWDLTTITEPGHPTQVVPGLLWQGQGVEAIHQCPSFEGAANWSIDPYTGYNYNTSYIGHGQREAVPTPAKAVSVVNPAKTALFGDGEWAEGANKFMRAPWPNPGDESFTGRWSGTQGFRHLGYTNVAFCDGRAESLSERFTDNSDGSEGVKQGTGFISQDNSLYDLE